MKRFCNRPQIKEVVADGLEGDLQETSLPFHFFAELYNLLEMLSLCRGWFHCGAIRPEIDNMSVASMGFKNSLKLKYTIHMNTSGINKLLINIVFGRGIQI